MICHVPKARHLPCVAYALRCAQLLRACSNVWQRQDGLHQGPDVTGCFLKSTGWGTCEHCSSQHASTASCFYSHTGDCAVRRQVRAACLRGLLQPAEVRKCGAVPPQICAGAAVRAALSTDAAFRRFAARQRMYTAPIMS